MDHVFCLMAKIHITLHTTVFVVYECAVTLNLVYNSKVKIIAYISETYAYSLLFLSFDQTDFSFTRKGKRCVVTLNWFYSVNGFVEEFSMFHSLIKRSDLRSSPFHWFIVVNYKEQKKIENRIYNILICISLCCDFFFSYIMALAV